MKNSKPTYRELKSLQNQIKNQTRLNTYVRREVLNLEMESEQDRYLKTALDKILGFPKFVLYLFTYPMILILSFPLILMLVVGMLFLATKDFIKSIFRLCFSPFKK